MILQLAPLILLTQFSGSIINFWGSGAENGTVDGKVYVIDTATDTIIDTIQVGLISNSLAISPDNSTLYVSESGLASSPNNQVSIIDTQTDTITGTITVGLYPTEMAIGVFTPSANQPPAMNPLSGATVNEGAAYTANGSFTDPDSSSWTATVDYGDGSGVQPLPLSGTTFSLSHLYRDEGTYTITVSVTDNQGAMGTTTATVAVTNVPFTVSAISAPTVPNPVNTAITASASFSDPGPLDTHTGIWTWGDGTTSTGTIIESNGTGSVQATHTYPQAGVYTIGLTVTDDDGVSVSASP